MKGKIRVGIGGWTYEPWRGTFYPKGLPQKGEFEFASRRLTSIEINGTYYSTQKPESFARWREETPKGFVFAVKGPRFTTNRRPCSGQPKGLEPVRLEFGVTPWWSSPCGLIVSPIVDREFHRLGSAATLELHPVCHDSLPIFVGSIEKHVLEFSLNRIQFLTPPADTIAVQW
jgi:uncharacterized protein YecE (DUF72 family)